MILNQFYSWKERSKNTINQVHPWYLAFGSAGCPPERGCSKNTRRWINQGHPATREMAGATLLPESTLPSLPTKTLTLFIGILKIDQNQWFLSFIFILFYLKYEIKKTRAGYEGIAPPKWSLFFQSLQAGQRQKRWRQNLSRFGDISSKLPANQCCKEIDLSIFTALDRANGSNGCQKLKQKKN